MGVSIDPVSAPTLPPDFVAALDGGEHFVKRLGVLQQAKKDADAAFAALQLGESITEAQAALDQKTAEAEAEAEKIIAAAKAEAERIIEKAMKILNAFAQLDTPAP